MHCQGCNQPLGALHDKDCVYRHPWPKDRVDNVQTKVAPVGAQTGRFSAANPNLNAVPRYGAWSGLDADNPPW